MDIVVTDLVVVGAGASGLLAAVAARRLGHEVLVVEASELAGGTTALSDGRLWLPGNHLMAKLGTKDSAEEAAAYLEAVLGAETTASPAERRAAFLETAPKVGRWLTSSKLSLFATKGVPDHHGEAPGAKQQGRVVQSHPVDLRMLGDWEDSLRGPVEAPDLAARVAARLLPRHGSRGTGEALGAELLHRAAANGVEIWLRARVVELLSGTGGVEGVVVRRAIEDSEATNDVRVVARRGVLLASGGFEANQAMREEYLPLPTDASWSASGIVNDGSVLALATALGAATAGMDDAWWVPVLIADSQAHRIDRARSNPHGLIVDQAGDRFFNEAAPGVIAGRQLYERSRGVRAIPSYLIVDNHHRQQNSLGPWPAGTTPKRAIETGDIVKASTLNDLAQELGIDRAGLLGTVVRFNNFASKGRDLDFRRGEATSAPKQSGRRNVSLGKLAKPPFWAVRVYPGDEGTKGGVVIDANSRVLDGQGAVIPGLYACGGAAASMMGRTSPGPGAALAAAFVEAFLAVTKLDPAP